MTVDADLKNLLTVTKFIDDQLEAAGCPPKTRIRMDVVLDEWAELKAVIHDETAAFYLNGAEEPVLTVSHMKHGADACGSVGFFSEIGTEAFFKDLEIEFED